MTYDSRSEKSGGLKLAALLAIFLFAACGLPALAQTPDELAERQRLAEEGQLLIDSELGIAASASELATAVDIPAGLVTNTTLSGPSAGTAVFSNLGVIQPKQGDSLAVLSSGIAGTGAPEPGVDFSPLGTAGDSVTLTITFDVPENMNRLSFDWNFLSAEFPDFVGSVFNDTFRATLTDAGGSRTVAFASVNSSFFFAASGSRAGGTGFDIFTENPSGVDTSFGGGLPDAGLTDWQSVNVPIAGGGPATLSFNIRDLGDGILDSAVVIDNVTVTALEVVDPNPDLLDGDDVTTDTDSLATGGEPVVGAAADGVTRVVLRTTVPGSGSVEFSLVDASAPDDGGLSEVGSDDRLNTVMVSTVETSEGFQAFALYYAPPEFNRGGDEGEAERDFRFKARFVPDNGDPAESELPFKLVRPPVVLVHGLWSSAGTWSFPLVSDSRFEVTIADYSATNASYFSINRNVPFTYVREALTKMRNQDIAVTQADFGGHSMGGILSRLHIARANYKTAVNFNEGDVHKLVTLNTPHTGSPLANFLLFLRDDLGFVSDWIVEKARDWGHPLDEGAIDDLAKGSSAINAIPATPVPAHALVGVGGSDLTGDALALLPGNIGLIFSIINLIDDNTDIFAGIQHDAIVGRRSQEGGMPPSATTIFNGLESVHTFVTGSANYSNRIVELYNTTTTASDFSTFPAPSTLSLSEEKAAQLRDKLTKAALIEGGIEITTPTGGTVSSGGTVLVTVEPKDGFDLQRVLIGSRVGAVIVEAPFSVNYEIPIEAVGAIELVALGVDSNGDFATSNEVPLQVEPPATLQSVTILNRDPILFGTGKTRQLAVAGLYSDGVVRDITDPSTGTFYQTSNGFIAQVDSAGLVTSTGLGIVTIVARQSGRQDSVSVTVLEGSDNEPPIANAGPDQFVGCETSGGGVLVTLDGSGSFDPDGDPLTYTWTGAFGTATGVSPTVLVPVGINDVTLTVEDGKGGSDSDVVVITAGDTDPPEIVSLSASPDMLWPPDHKMVEVLLSAEAIDTCDPDPQCEVTGVTSNEPIDGDWAVTGPLSVDLRAWRLGQGDGRVYSIEVSCTDLAGNVATGTTDVLVPHDQGE